MSLNRAYIYSDHVINGWNDAQVRQALGFATLPETVRSHYPPTGLFSICAETRRGVKGFSVMDMRSSRRLRVGRKATATRVAKLIEEDFDLGAQGRPVQ